MLAIFLFFAVPLRAKMLFIVWAILEGEKHHVFRLIKWLRIRPLKGLSHGGEGNVSDMGVVHR